MTATEIMRRLLDERGVEYEVDEQGWVFFEGNGLGWVFVGSDTHGQLLHQKLFITPEQAIAATLGAGTCHDEGDPSDFCCSACGMRMFTNTSDTYTMIASDERTIIKRPNYCPNCGAKVIEPTTNDVDAEVEQ